ncbi:MAG: hypothetical protein ABIO36_06920, partial [Pyrinomonadaceae bacterium]
MHNSKCTIHNFFLLFCILYVAYCISACSIPNLEKPQCMAARDNVKRFYSYHFGNDMHPSPENLKARQAFLTSELIKSLLDSNETAKDYFTATDNYPKAFRVGECKLDADDRVTLQIVLLWRDETKSEQKEVHVETI